MALVCSNLRVDGLNSSWEEGFCDLIEGVGECKESGIVRLGWLILRWAGMCRGGRM